MSDVPGAPGAPDDAPSPDGRPPASSAPLGSPPGPPAPASPDSSWGASYPASAAGPPEPVAPRPSLVTAAFWLALAAAALQIISGVVTLFEIPLAMRVARDATSQVRLTETEIQAAVFAGVAVAEVLFLVIIVLLVVSAFGVRRGSGWARVLLIVVAAVSLLQVTKLLGIIVFIPLVVAVVLVWLPASTRWFRAVKARRLGS